MLAIINEPPGYRFYEYLLILSPHQDLCDRMLALKKEFGTAFKAEANVGGKPHIALVKFTQRIMLEDKLVNRLRNIAMGTCPFKVEIKGFTSQPTHSIFFNVATQAEIKKLSKELHGAQQLMKSTEAKPHFIVDPQIVLARKLLPWQYEHGWLEMSNRHFTGKFIADAMLLLRRRVGEGAYQIIQRLELQNLPVSTKQGELFASF